jgi:putative endonuclease
MFFIYIIRSSTTQRYYAGSTQDVDKRLREHNAGKSKSTRGGMTWKLIHSESFTTRSEAVQREQKIKAKGIGRYLSNLEKQTPD